MDVEANLAEQRRLTREILRVWACADPNTGELSREQAADIADDAERLAELSEALDAWLCKGGALPTDWQR